MRKLLILILTFLCTAGLYAQSLEDYLSKYTQKNGEMYLQPFADAFSADFNSGLFHNAKLKKKGFQFYLGVVAMMAPISNDAKYFQAYTEGGIYDSQGPYKVPTVFGPTDGVEVPIDGSGGLINYTFPGGFDVDMVPLAMPQLTIGSLFGTDLTLRYVTADVEDIGEIDVFGWGLRHSIDQYIPLIPLNLAVGYYNQSFKVGEYMDAKTTMINLQTSYSIPVLTFYGGIGYEKSKVDVEYEYTGDDFSVDKISFKMDAANTMRFTIGLGLNLGPVKIHGDYNMAKQNTFAVGLGIGINEK